MSIHPLEYVVGKHTALIPNFIYTTEQEESISIAPLNGDDFQHDNAREHGIIKQLLREGPGRSYILPQSNTGNGRAVWAHFEEESYQNRILKRHRQH